MNRRLALRLLPGLLACSMPAAVAQMAGAVPRVVMVLTSDEPVQVLRQPRGPDRLCHTVP